MNAYERLGENSLENLDYETFEEVMHYWEQSMSFKSPVNIIIISCRKQLAALGEDDNSLFKKNVERWLQENSHRYNERSAY